MVFTCLEAEVILFQMMPPLPRKNKDARGGGRDEYMPQGAIFM